MITIKYSELSNAFEFVSSGSISQQKAYICMATGTIYWVSKVIELEEDNPEDIETSDLYISVPHKNDFNLGQEMALAFIHQEHPDIYNTVASFFRKRGAYRRFKELLQVHGLIEKWYEFEAGASKKALLEWCQRSNINLEGAP